MPVSVDNSRVIYDALKAVDVRLMSALPETWLVHLIRMAEDDPEVTLVRLAKEEEGVGIVEQAISSTEGFTFVLTGLKAVLEHGLNLNLIGDRMPKG